MQVTFDLRGGCTATSFLEVGRLLKASSSQPIPPEETQITGAPCVTLNENFPLLRFEEDMSDLRFCHAPMRLMNIIKSGANTCTLAL